MRDSSERKRAELYITLIIVMTKTCLKGGKMEEKKKKKKTFVTPDF